MRPPGAIRAALQSAAEELWVREVVDGVPCERGPTLQELAHRACVGLEAARRTVNNMARSGALRVMRARRQVGRRSSPVAEYVPAVRDGESLAEELGAATAAWAHR